MVNSFILDLRRFLDGGIILFWDLLFVIKMLILDILDFVFVFGLKLFLKM